jgi:hypothetical protein
MRLFRFHHFSIKISVLCSGEAKRRQCAGSLAVRVQEDQKFGRIKRKFARRHEEVKGRLTPVRKPHSRYYRVSRLLKGEVLLHS